MTKINIGDFIYVPAWKTEGMCTEILLPVYGSDDVQEIMLQEFPESEPTRYHLEPGEWTYA